MGLELAGEYSAGLIISKVSAAHSTHVLSHRRGFGKSTNIKIA